jgi:hypothetical protein
MVRVDNLRAKSLQAEVAYLNDLKRVGDYKRIEQQQRKVFERSQRTFWAESLKAQTPPFSGHGSVPSPAYLPNQLERMWQGHKQLQHASNEYTGTVGRLQSGIAQLASSQKRLELLEKLITKAFRAKAHQVESRLSDDLSELFATRRQGISVGRGIVQHVAPQESLSVRQDESILERPFSTSKAVLAFPAIPLNSISAKPTAAPAPETKAVSLAPPSLNVSEVHVHAGQGCTTLSLSCSLRGVGTVGLALVRESNGNLTARLDPGTGGLAMQLLGERTKLHSRLQSLGLNVTSLEVCGGDTPGYSLNRRPRLKAGDYDEDVIP